MTTNERDNETPGAGLLRGRITALILASFVVGGVLGALLIQRATRPGPVAAQARELSDATRSALQRLETPVEIHFYDLLDPSLIASPVEALGGRVEKLLEAYRAEAGDKLKIVVQKSEPTDELQNAASADGLKPFNIEKGAACYLGIAVIGQGARETMAQLTPEWEEALEFDLTRAIARVAAARPPGQAAAAPAAVSEASLQAVKQLIPDINAVSEEEGAKILRQAAVADFARVAQEMNTRIKAAEEAVKQAQASNSEADQQAALQQLQQAQAEQAAQLKEIAARSQAEVDAFISLKKAPGSVPRQQ